MAIDGQGLDRVAVLVVRHFGGIKLGSGGLVRAYGGCAAECLRTATKIPIVQFVTISISCTFSLSSQVHDLLQRHGGSKNGERFEADGVTLSASLPESSLEPFQRDLAALSRGTIAFRIVED